MFVLYKIALSQIRQHKNRFIFTVFITVLCTAMMFTMLTASDVALRAFRSFVIAQDGNWHWTADTLTAQALTTLQEQETHTELAASGAYGGKISTTYQNVGVELYGISGDFLNMMQTDFVQGKLPTNVNELAIDQKFADQYNMKLGDVIDFSDEPSERYTIVGIWGNSVVNIQFPIPENDFLAFYGYSASEQKGEDCYRYFTLAKTLNQKYYTTSDAQTLFLQENYPQSYSFYHNTLITVSGLSSPNGINMVAFFVALFRGVFLIVIVFVCSMMILNFFAISFDEQKQLIGLLASIGATKRQASWCLIYEAFFVGAIGIPIGIVVGYGSVLIIFQQMSPLIHLAIQTLHLNWQFSVPIYFGWILVSGVLNGILLCISAYLPVRKFSKDSVIHSILKQDQSHINKKIISQGRFSAWIFGAIGNLAIKNAKRNVWQYHAIVRSLALCIAVFVASVGFTIYIPQIATSQNNLQYYNVSVNYATTSAQNLAQTEEYQRLISPQTPLENMEIKEIISAEDSMIPMDLYTKETIEIATQCNASTKDSCYNAMINLHVIPDTLFETLCPEVLKSKNETPCVLYNTYFYQNTSVKQTRFQVKDTIETALQDMPIKLSIAAIDTQKFPQQRYGAVTTLDFAISQTQADALFLSYQQKNANYLPRTIEMNYQTEFAKNLIEELQPIAYNNGFVDGVGDYLVISDQEIEYTLTQLILLLLHSIVYGVSGFIAMICICNVITTISKLFSMQEKEFLLLKSVGTTQNQLKKMLLLQCGCYCVASLFWAIVLSFGLLWCEYTSLSSLGVFFFIIPWKSFVFGYMVVIAILAFLIRFPLRKIAQNGIAL